MTIVQGSYHAMVEEVSWPATVSSYFQVAIACHGRIVYYQLEDTFQNAWQVALAYINWKLKQDNVAAQNAEYHRLSGVGQRTN